MSDTRMYGNKMRTIWVAAAAGNPFTDPSQPTDDEINAMLNISSVVKWDSTDVGVQDSDKIDDRVLTDAAGAQRRGFVQFGGTLNLLTPKSLANVADLATKAFTLFKTPRAVIWVVDRVGYANTTPSLPGQRINVYKVAVDAKKNQTSGDTSYSYTVKLVPQGDVLPQQITADTTPLAITTSGFTTALKLSNLAYTWGMAKIGTTNVTTQATWTSSNPAVATVDNRGLVTALSAGTTNIVVSYPGATSSTAIAITVTAS